MTDTLTFKTRSRRDDQFGHKTVELNLDDLLNAYNTFVSKFQQGTALVPAGTTSVVVTHSYGSAAYQVFAAPNPTEAGARWFISNKVAGSFQINLNVAAPAGGSPFDWMLKGA